MKEVMTRIAWKNHKNGALNPRAQFKKEVGKDVICNSPLVAGPLGIFDCSGVSDGAACAIIVRAEDAHKYTDKPLYVKALSFTAGPAFGPMDPEYDYTTFTEVSKCAEDAYKQAGVTDPRGQIAMAEVHDLSLIHISEPTRRYSISYAVFCLKKKSTYIVPLRLLLI